MFKKILRISTIIAMMAGLYGASIVSYETIVGEKGCPKVLDIHACYIVFSGYFWMLISIFLPKTPSKLRFISFLIGWPPVFALAALASGLELVTQNICPKSNAGIPLCFISLALSVFVLITFLISNKAPSMKQFDVIMRKY